MALCTQCGTLFNDEDEHICDKADIPAKGQPIKKGLTKQ
jgi:rRNA maturation endonuclease Nob1